MKSEEYGGFISELWAQRTKSYGRKGTGASSLCGRGARGWRGQQSHTFNHRAQGWPCRSRARPEQGDGHSDPWQQEGEASTVLTDLRTPCTEQAPGSMRLGVGAEQDPSWGRLGPALRPSMEEIAPEEQKGPWPHLAQNSLRDNGFCL